MGQGEALVIRQEGPAQSPTPDGRVNDQGVQHHDVAVRHVIAPGDTGVYVHLHLVQNGGACRRTVMAATASRSEANALRI